MKRKMSFPPGREPYRRRAPPASRLHVTDGFHSTRAGRSVNAGRSGRCEPSVTGAVIHGPLSPPLPHEHTFTHKSVREAGGRWIHQQQRENVIARNVVTKQSPQAGPAWEIAASPASVQGPRLAPRNDTSFNVFKLIPPTPFVGKGEPLVGEGQSEGAVEEDHPPPNPLPSREGEILFSGARKRTGIFILRGVPRSPRPSTPGLGRPPGGHASRPRGAEARGPYQISARRATVSDRSGPRGCVPRIRAWP